jgi:hypothetical protein
MSDELIDFRKLEWVRRNSYVLFLAGYPIAGFLVGHLCIVILDVALGPQIESARKLCVYLWSGVGLLAGIYSAWRCWNVDKAIDAAIEQTQPTGLISILLDRSLARPRRRAAARDLAAFDDAHAEDALSQIARDPDEIADIVESARESLKRIRARNL